MQALYRDLDATWDRRAAQLNQRLREQGLPVQVANLSTVWSVFYTQPSRYNWMLQFYLRAHGLALSWVGTGRLVFTLMHSDDDMDDILRRFCHVICPNEKPAPAVRCISGPFTIGS